MSLVVLLQSPLFPPLALALLALAHLALRSTRPGNPVDDADTGRPDDEEVKRWINEAIEAKRRGDMSRAGWLYEQGNLWVKAGECHEAGGDALWAAKLYARGGDYRRAGELYRRHGFPLEAASILEQGGMLGDAGVCLVVIGDLPRAAALFVRAGRPEDAAELYLRIGAYHRAGKLFEEARDRARAADAYEKMIDSLGRKQLDAPREIATVLEEEGRIDATIRFLEAVGEVLQALRVAIRYQHDQATRLYGEYREILAGPLLRGAEEGKLSAKVLSDLFERAGDHIPAARMALQMGQTARAARLFEDGGQDTKAAEAWEAAGEVREAALAWERAGHHGQAGSFYEQIDDPLRAVHCYRQGELHFDAGRLYQILGEEDNAIAALGQVTRSDPHRRTARLQLGRMMISRDRWEAAVGYFEEALGELEPTLEEVDDLVALARVLEAQERFGDAAACWRSVNRLDPLRADADEAFVSMRDRAARDGQDVPQAYPYAPVAPSASPPVAPDGPGAGAPAAAQWGAAQGLDLGGGDELAPGLVAPPDSGAGADLAQAHPAQAPGGEPFAASPVDEPSLPDWSDPMAPDGADMVSFEAYTDLGDDDLLADLGTRPRPGSKIAAGQVSLVSASLPPGVEGDTGGWPAWESGTEGERREMGPFTPAGEMDAGASDPRTARDPDPPPSPGESLVLEPEPGVGALDPFSQSADLADFGLGGGLTDELGDLLEDASESLTPREPPWDAFEMFATFEPAERAQLGTMLRLYDANAGDELYHGEDKRDGLILLADGQLEVRGGEEPPTVVTAADVAGERMLLEGELPLLSARALTDVRCWMLSRVDARELAQRDRDLAVKLARALRRRADAP